MLPELDATSVAMQYVFKGGEVAIKVAGVAAKNLALMLIALLQQKNRSKGQVWVKTMSQQGTPLITFPVPVDRLKEFSELAKQREIMYSRIKSKGKGASASHVDIIARQNDVALLKDIFSKLGFSDLPVAGNIESKPITKEARLKNEKNGMTTVYDHEIRETAERPTISGRRSVPSARYSENSLGTETRPSVRAALKSFNAKQALGAKIPTKVKTPAVPTK